MSRLPLARSVLRSPWMAALALAGCLLAPGSTSTQAVESAGAPAAVPTVFPLSIQPGRRYLQDAAGKPFLLHGDTAWSLIAQLRREEAETYLEDRRRRGFNTILVNLLEHKFASRAPANAYGERPFLDAGDFAAPNEAYFAHADWVLRRAAEKGMLVLLAPAYLGYGGGNEGWYAEMTAAGPTKLRAYGEYVGRRYREFTNILWVHAGDFDPPRKDLVRAVADGIRAIDRHALHTAHPAPETVALDYWAGEPWLRLGNVYTYKPVYVAALAHYARPERLPFILLESAYENEHGAGELRLRIQAYQALLSGAAGQVYGNNPIWRFDGPALHKAPMSWRQALDSRGAQSMTHLRSLFGSLPWWQLEPDTAGTFLTGGTGSGEARAVAALTADRSLAVVYLPGIHAVRLDLARMSGPEVAARWFDPASGRFADVAGAPFPATGPQQLRPRALNGAGQPDWLLLLESKSQDTAATRGVPDATRRQ